MTMSLCLEFYISQTSESCLGVLNNMYNDSITWVSGLIVKFSKENWCNTLFKLNCSMTLVSCFNIQSYQKLIDISKSYISHPSACYHQARFICEDSELLLKEVLEQKDETNDNQESGLEKIEDVSTTEATVLTTRSVNKIEDDESSTKGRRRKVFRKKLTSDTGK